LVSMNRSFKTVGYDATLDLTVRLSDRLAPCHLVRVVVGSPRLLAISLHARHGQRYGEPYAPRALLALLIYGCARGVFGARTSEWASDEAVPFRFIMGNPHTTRDTRTTVRHIFPSELKDLCAKALLLAHEENVLTLGRISMAVTKIHADTSKSVAMSDKRLLGIEVPWRAKVAESFALSERTDQREATGGLVARDEIARREGHLATAKAMLEARAHERAVAEQVAVEQVAYEKKRPQQAERGCATGGRPDEPPRRPHAWPRHRRLVQLYRPNVTHYGAAGTQTIVPFSPISC